MLNRREFDLATDLGSIAIPRQDRGLGSPDVPFRSWVEGRAVAGLMKFSFARFRKHASVATFWGEQWVVVALVAATHIFFRNPPRKRCPYTKIGAIDYGGVKLRRRFWDMTNPSKHSEGSTARAIEEQTAKLPSDTFLWLAIGSIAASLTLKCVGKDHGALFVGQWAPTFLILGLYNKTVKQLGSDRTDT